MRAVSIARAAGSNHLDHRARVAAGFELMSELNRSTAEGAIACVS